MTSWIGRSCVLGSTKSVAPIFLANGHFSGFISIAMIRLALAFFKPWITAKPIAPSPKTAVTAPSSTFAVLSTAPNPVVTPHPNSGTVSRGASSVIFTKLISLTTVYSLNVLVPI